MSEPDYGSRYWAWVKAAQSDDREQRIRAERGDLAENGDDMFNRTQTFEDSVDSVAAVLARASSEDEVRYFVGDVITFLAPSDDARLLQELANRGIAASTLKIVREQLPLER